MFKKLFGGGGGGGPSSRPAVAPAVSQQSVNRTVDAIQKLGEVGPWVGVAPPDQRAAACERRRRGCRSPPARHLCALHCRRKIC